ncbi:MAG: hypothetical protein DWQ01_13225 [Planctomycetota bacterium]|nr:MAG: hypothetical protein DWQ01_13225 [Planctomycetota bacterium]
MTFRKKTTGQLLSLATALVTVACCSSPPQFPAQGTVAGYEFTGPVDSEMARDYLAGTLPVDLKLLRRGLISSPWVLSSAELEVLAKRYSPDVATLLWVESIAGQPANAAVRRLYERELDRLRALSPSKPVAPVGSEGVCVLLVPGWFYLSHGSETGADLELQRTILRTMGVENHRVALDENGTVEENAEKVANAIRKYSKRFPHLILVSASKSSAEVALALGRLLPSKERKNVKAWLSVGGVLRGSPLADRVLEPDLVWLGWLKFRLQGFGLQGLRSMRTDLRRTVFGKLSFADHILLLSYIAVPLSGNISSRGSFGYACMREYGPNDGLTLLADEVFPGGLVLLEPSVDHFFEQGRRAFQTAALFSTVLSLMKK